MRTLWYILPAVLLAGCVTKQPVAIQPPPVAPVAARSCTNARNGAMPVPGPTRMQSRAPSSGGPKCESDTNTGTGVAPTCARSARNVEHTPTRSRWFVS